LRDVLLTIAGLVTIPVYGIADFPPKFHLILLRAFVVVLVDDIGGNVTTIANNLFGDTSVELVSDVSPPDGVR
jgi:hypothetical protein